MATITLNCSISSKPQTRMFSLINPSLNFIKPFNPNKKKKKHNLKALALDFSSSFFEGGFGGLDEDPPSSSSGPGLAVEDKPEPQCPPGLRQYETMVVLRPDMTEDERLSLTQKYEEFSFTGYQHIPTCRSSSSSTSSVVDDEQQDSSLPFNGCKGCGKEVIERGCNSEGRIQGGIATIPGFGWWPIKAYRPCPGFLASGGNYRRRGQRMDEVAFGGGKARASVDDFDDTETRKKGKNKKQFKS